MRLEVRGRRDPGCSSSRAFTGCRPALRELRADQLAGVLLVEVAALDDLARRREVVALRDRGAQVRAEVRDVTGEQLVAAVAAHHHLHVLSREAVHGVVRVRRRRDRGLLLVPDPLVDLVPEVVERRVRVVRDAADRALDLVDVFALVDALARVQRRERVQPLRVQVGAARHRSRAIVVTTPLESRPPESGTPTGTSEMRWRRTTSSQRPANSSA